MPFATPGPVNTVWMRTVPEPIDQAEPEARRGLGTFAGVFTPSILTILGIILFLRTGYVVGNAGLAGAFAIIGIATAVSVLTSLSLSAIATNINVRGGGDYYLISRTLGLEFGGAIGVVLFLAQSVSIAFYAIGFAEAATEIVGWDNRFGTQIIAAIAIGALFLFAWAGADVATKLQFVIMAILMAALLSFFLGAIPAFDGDTLSRSWSAAAGSIGFWAAFAIFFPAVTGFTQGVSMSGDLKDPGKSLPTGTFAAVGVSTVVYIGVAILLAGGVPQIVLRGDGGEAMRSLAWIAALVGLGVIAATLSSAMASFLGAPRILQSMASDHVFPLIDRFAHGHGESANPRRAVLLSLAIALVTVSLGSVDLIAPIVSMFFLISYVLINPYAGAIAIVALFVVYQYLARRAIPERWADASQSHHFQRAVESISAMDKELEHPRNWRPQILVFSADPSRRTRLLRFAKWIEGSSGLTAAFRIVVGKGIRARIEADKEQESLKAEIESLELDVHARAVLVPDGIQALPIIVQSFGVGRIRSNVVLFGWPESSDEERLATYVGVVREVARLGVSVVSLSTDEARWERFLETPGKDRRIDVWWEDTDSGRLGLLAAYLVTREAEWRRASIRLIVDGGADPEAVRSELMAMLDQARIDAAVHVIEGFSREAVVTAAEDAALVLIPMHLRRGSIVDPLDGDMIALATELPMTAAFHAGSPIVLDTDPSSGIAEEIVAAEQAANDAKERLRKLEEQLDTAHNELEVMDVGTATEAQIAEAEETLERIHRRTLSARARVERTSAEAEAMLRKAR